MKHMPVIIMGLLVLMMATPYYMIATEGQDTGPWLLDEVFAQLLGASDCTNCPCSTINRIKIDESKLSPDFLVIPRTVVDGCTELVAAMTYGVGITDSLGNLWGFAFGACMEDGGCYYPDTDCGMFEKNEIMFGVVRKNGVQQSNCDGIPQDVIYEFINEYGLQGATPPSGITVISPNGGETITKGSTYTVLLSTREWSGAIELMKNDATYQTIAMFEEYQTSYSWDVDENLPDGADYQIQIWDYGGGSDTSDGYFTIDGGSGQQDGITIISPNGGETITKGSTYTVRYTAAPANGYISLWKAGSEHSHIGMAARGSTSFQWTVSQSIPDGSDYRVRMSTISDPPVSDFSDGDFSIGSGSSGMPDVDISIDTSVIAALAVSGLSCLGLAFAISRF